MKQDAYNKKKIPVLVFLLLIIFACFAFIVAGTDGDLIYVTCGILGMIFSGATIINITNPN